MDRSKFKDRFKATKMSVIEDQDKKVASVIGSSGGAGRLGYHNIRDNGDYKFRLAPAHPDSPSYIMPLTVHFLPFKEEKDGRQVTKKKPVFNARIHGKKGEQSRIDIIEEYIRITKKLAGQSFQDEDDYDEYIKHIDGYRENGKYQGGIKPANSSIVYAWDIVNGKMTTLARLQLNYTLKNGLNIIASKGEIGTEPFTDIDEGMPITIGVDSAKKGKDKFSVTYAITTGSYPTPLPLTDQQLTEFSEVESLAKIYQGMYSSSDFEKALEGLENFDKQHQYNTFQNEEFIEIVKQLADLYDNPDEAKTATASQGEVQEDPAKAKRSELKRYIKANSLPVRVTKNMTNDDIAAAIKATEEAMEEDEEEEDDEPNIDDLDAMFDEDDE